MSYGRFRLLSQLGAGRDGARYRASDRSDGSAVEMVLLAEARADPDRWRGIGRRLRVTLMIAHPSSRQVVGLDLESDPPFLALEWVDGPTLAESGREEWDATTRTIELALALAAGHRLGLALGRVGPGLIRSRGQNPSDLVLDWLGLDLDSSPKSRLTYELDESCRAPELVRGADPDASSDVYALGAILDWRLGGLSTSGAGLDSSAGKLLREMLDPDPDARPTARAVADRLTSEVVPTRAIQIDATSRGASTSLTTGFEPDDTPVGDGEPLGRAQLGRFRLLEILGHGGMGTGVYMRRRISPDGSLVAVKVLKRAFAGRPESLLEVPQGSSAPWLRSTTRGSPTSSS